MAFWRRRGSQGRRSAAVLVELGDPVEAFVELGVPRPAAEAITRLLRGPVTDRVCALLPGLENASGVRWLWSLSAVFPDLASEVARRLLPPGGADRSETAALVGLWLHPISVELAARHDAASPGQPIARRPPGGVAPAPSALLREVHAHHAAGVARAVEAGGPNVQVMQRAGTAVAQMAAVPLDDGEDPAWGGWGLLAVLQAFDEFEEMLPRPGRTRARPPGQEAGAQAAGQAFSIGRDIMLTTALALIGNAGGSGVA